MKLNKEFALLNHSEILIKEVLSDDDMSKMWRISTKSIFMDDVPFLIFEFSKPTNELVCKSPVTYTSLFESNAVYEEINLFLRLAQKENYNNDRKLVENRNYFRNCYDSELIEYSVAAHIVSMVLEIADVFQAYSVSSQLCSFLLNIPRTQLEKIAKKNISEAPLSLHFHRIINRDFGYLLYYFCTCYKSQFKALKEFDLDDFLTFFDLSSRSEIEQEIYFEIENRIEDMNPNDYLYPKFHTIMKNGFSLLKKRGLLGNNVDIWDILRDPDYTFSILFGDVTWENESNINQLLSIPIVSLTNLQWYDLVELI
ncbi:MAG: hypothetical protein ABI844_18360, partial [Saprospiraceae bacterium]